MHTGEKRSAVKAMCQGSIHTGVRHSIMYAHPTSSSPGGSCASKRGDPEPNKEVSQINVTIDEALISVVSSPTFALQREPLDITKRGRESNILSDVFTLLRKHIHYAFIDFDAIRLTPV